MNATTTVSRLCCRRNGIIPGDGQETRVCYRHADDDLRTLWKSLEMAAPSVGVKRQPDGFINWPYGPNIRLSSREAMVDWAQERGLKLSKGDICLHWLLGNRRGTRRSSCWSRGHHGFGDLRPSGVVLSSSWLDHVTGWTRPNGEPFALVSQPYSLSAADRDALELLGTKPGLCVEIDDDSGWYGLGTAWIEISRVGDIDLLDPPPVCSACGVTRGHWFIHRQTLTWYCDPCQLNLDEDKRQSVNFVDSDGEGRERESTWLEGRRNDLRSWMRMATFLHDTGERAP